MAAVHNRVDGIAHGVGGGLYRTAEFTAFRGYQGAIGIVVAGNGGGFQIQQLQGGFEVGFDESTVTSSEVFPILSSDFTL